MFVWPCIIDKIIWTANCCGIMHRRCCQQAASSVHYTTSCKHSLALLRMREIITQNMLSWLKLLIKLLLLHLVGCLYYCKYIIFFLRSLQEESLEEIYYRIIYFKVLVHVKLYVVYNEHCRLVAPDSQCFMSHKKQFSVPLTFWRPTTTIVIVPHR